jgi:hypothetical protein
MSQFLLCVDIYYPKNDQINYQRNEIIVWNYNH